MFHEVCKLDDLWEGEMEVFDVGGTEVLLVHADGGHVRAFPASCPHQDQPLIEGQFEDGILTCSAHLWQFDVMTGLGINPTDCKLLCIPVKVENGVIFVDIVTAEAASVE
ncbi:Rieske 2Fe-2S domain-containing protein [Limibacillus sp. MBR-115]|uniref:Rieske 2Fe-2S domain-containing protein n=1 Tax=Limibacillus sp. MBR-115 TaxID=3156465 RepID=UPI0033952D3C